MTTKEKLLHEAFIQFATKPYNQVTFSDLENAVNISRGALVYHVKNKERLFADVLEEFVFKKNSILELPIAEKDVLLNFIKSFMLHCYSQKEKAAKLGLDNINSAFFNIENQSIFYYSNISVKVKQWLSVEKNIWKNILEISKEKGEIDEKINTEIVASIIEEIFIGNSYIGIFQNRGHDIDLLEKELMAVYALIKK